MNAGINQHKMPPIGYGHDVSAWRKAQAVRFLNLLKGRNGGRLPETAQECNRVAAVFGSHFMVYRPIPGWTPVDQRGQIWAAVEDVACPPVSALLAALCGYVLRQEAALFTPKPGPCPATDKDRAVICRDVEQRIERE